MLLTIILIYIFPCFITLTLPCSIQGSSVYSETAAKNYGNWNVFEIQIPRIPAKRLCRPEEVFFFQISYLQLQQLLSAFILQGSSIYSKTAEANYANVKGHRGFRFQIPRIPAKRLGRPEEVP